MADFAIVQDGTVVNVIVAEDKATAQAVTGLDVLPIIDDVPGMGWTRHDGTWRPPAPFPSWAWDGTSWQAPLPYPGDGAVYLWDEEQGEWIEYVATEPESAPEE